MSMRAELAESQADKAPLRYTRAIQLRAALKHLDDVTVLSDKVCDANEFRTLMGAASN